MPALCLHIGQCGNQIGYEIWDRLQYEAKKSKLSASGVTRDPASAPLYSDELGFFMREDARGDGLHQAIGFYRTTYIFAPRCWNVVFAQAAGCYRARAILVDTEPKVVASLRQNELLANSAAITAQQGRGNNWAFGFHGLTKLKRRQKDGPAWGDVRDGQPGKPRWQNAVEITRAERYGEEENSVLRRTLEAARKEAEAADEALDIVLVHSLGGGTGSGLGARILEALRTEMFRRNFILSVTVGPTVSGDTVLQSYNAALCLERLQRHSDAVALFRNSALIDSLGGEGAGGPGRGRGVELADVNSYIAAALLGCLLPVRGTGASMCGSRLQNLVAQVAPHPPCKLFDVQCTTVPMVHEPLGTHASVWSDVSRQLGSQRQRGMQGRASSAATALAAWGLDIESLPPHPDPRAPRSQQPESFEAKAALWTGAVLSAFHRSAGYEHPDWAKAEVLAETSPNAPSCVSCVPGGKIPAVAKGAGVPRNAMEGRHSTLTVAANTGDIADYVSGVHARGSELAQAGAYLHWYSKYGVEKHEVESALDELQTIVESYQSIHGH